MFAQLLQKLLKRNRLRHRKNLRPRRHHFAHQLVAKFHRGAHQVAIALFQNAFLFAGFEQRLHIDRGLFFGVAGSSANEATEKKKRTKTVIGRDQATAAGGWARPCAPPSGLACD